MKKLVILLAMLMLSMQACARSNFIFRVNLSPYPPVYYRHYYPVYVQPQPVYVQPLCIEGIVYDYNYIVSAGRVPMPVFNMYNKVIGYTCK